MWKMWIAAMALFGAGAVGVRELTVDVLGLIKGAEATEMRLSHLEKKGEDMSALLYSTREEIVSLRTVQQQLMQTLRDINTTLKELDQ
jgi:uncharacterized protein YkuJ